MNSVQKTEPTPADDLELTLRLLCDALDLLERGAFLFAICEEGPLRARLMQHVREHIEAETGRGPLEAQLSSAQPDLAGQLGGALVYELPLKAAEQARQRYRQILDQAEVEEPPPEAKQGKGRPKSTPGRNLLRRLTAHQEAVLAFALVEGVPFTNNQAERDLRPAKVKQKVSGCFRTGQGAKVYARLQAVISTCRKQERNIFATLRALFAHQPVSLIAET